MMRVLHLNVKESKIVSDSRFHAMDLDSRHWIPVSAGGTSIPDSNR